MLETHRCSRNFNSQCEFSEGLQYFGLVQSNQAIKFRGETKPFLTNIHDPQDSRGRGRLLPLSPPYYFHPLDRHFDIDRAIIAESSPLHITRSRTRTENLWFPSGDR